MTNLFVILDVQEGKTISNVPFRIAILSHLSSFVQVLHRRKQHFVNLHWMTPVLSAVNAVNAVADIPTDPSHVQDQVKMAGQAKTSMFLTWSSFCMIGNTRMGTVLVYHNHWSMVLHK